MARSWMVVPCLEQLFDEFDLIAPGRDRKTDGRIGDALHSSTSDHTPDEISDALRRKDSDNVNEVHAIDVDKDLRQPGLDMEKVVQFLLGRCRAGTEKRLRYIIWNRRIWEASNGWRQRTYTGKNAHDQHAHFSASYDTKLEASTASWGLEDEFMAVDYALIRQIVREEVDARIDTLTRPYDVKQDKEQENPLGKAALTQPIPNAFKGVRTDAYVVLDDIAKGVKQLVDGHGPSDV